MTFDEMMATENVRFEDAVEALRSASSEQLEKYVTTVEDNVELTSLAEDILNFRTSIRLDDRLSRAKDLAQQIRRLEDEMSLILDPLAKEHEAMADGDLRYLIEHMPRGFHQSELSILLRERSPVRRCFLDGHMVTAKTYRNVEPVEGRWMRLELVNKGGHNLPNIVDATVTTVRASDDFEATSHQ